MAPDQVVTVGFDGSPEAERAVRWAAFDAQTRGAPLRIVYAYSWPGIYEPIPMAGVAEQVEPFDIRTDANEIVGEMVEELVADLPDLDISGEAIEGNRIRALLDAADSSSVVVLGSRGLGPLAGALLGSVGASVSARASCPVVVVRPPADETVPPERRLVVGVDGSELTRGTLRFAFDQAIRHGLSLRAVMCWDPGVLPTPSRQVEDALTTARGRAEGNLAEALAGWEREYPKVSVERRLLDGNPIAVLAEESRSAQLLVVGAHNRRGRTGALLGSVSQGVLYHANSPTAIVHAPPPEAESA